MMQQLNANHKTCAMNVKADFVRVPLARAFCIVLPRIMKYPSDMKIAYMQQEADLDNTKTASEDRLQLPVLLCCVSCSNMVLNAESPCERHCEVAV